MKNFQHGLLSEMEAEWLDQVENTQAGGAPEGPCLKQKPTLRTWPERFVRIEGKALNVYGSPAVPVRNATPSLCPLVCLAVLPGRLRVVSCEADWKHTDRAEPEGCGWLLSRARRTAHAAARSPTARAARSPKAWSVGARPPTPSLSSSVPTSWA